ncbi:Bicyclomycin resistance protein [Capillimicrobium parvum]|uniref:Bicyclomycin resistance protein n=1 Tax=Capillimicrobium parvum TaxID=2884022 RepID=A0A9E6Y2X6_9ACTN|nr:Bicyclomycin resistance protein [Capillimicrobium parvum]
MLLGSLSTFGPLSMDLYLPGLTDLAGDLSVSASAAQLTITASLLGLAGGQFLGGSISDALGRRRPLLAGVALFAVTSLLCALAPNIWLLLAARTAQGMAGAVGIVIARAMVRDLVGGTEAARTYAMLILVTGLAPLLAPLVGGQLLHVTDWRGVFVVLAGLGIVLFAWALLRLPETLEPARRHTGGAHATGGAMAALLRDRAFVALALCIGLSFATLSVYLSGAVFLLEEIHGVSPQAFGLVLSVNGGLMIVTSQLSARLVRRVGPAPLLTSGLAVGAAGGAGLLVAVVAGIGLGLILPSLALVIASRGLINPNAQGLALADHPEAAGTASGMIGVVQFGLGAAVAPLAGVAGAENALPMALLITVMGAAALVLGLGVGSRSRTNVPGR